MIKPVLSQNNTSHLNHYVKNDSFLTFKKLLFFVRTLQYTETLILYLFCLLHTKKHLQIAENFSNALTAQSAQKQKFTILT